MTQLQNSQFSPCTVSWDSQEQTFKKNNKDDIYLCCNQRCQNSRETCNKFCQDDDRVENDSEEMENCKFSCNVMGNVCDKICESARFTWNQRSFDNCLIDSGCLRGEFLDNDCMVSSKGDLLNCCLQNCQPDTDLNCPQHCGISYDINLQRSLQGKNTEDRNISASQIPGQNNIKSDKLGLYLIIIFILLVIIFIILIFKINGKLR